MRIVRVSQTQGVSWGIVEGQDVYLCPSLGAALLGHVDGCIPLVPQSLLAPVSPGKVIGIAENFNARKGKSASEPLAFLKSPTSVQAPSKGIALVGADMQFWGEPELALVIGTRTRKASLEEAAEAILGFTVANDVTGRDRTERDHHLARYKAGDTLCPVGPWIDTDFVPGNQHIQGWQGQRLVRAGLISERSFSDAQIVCWLSQWITLEPGDLVLTGTPPRTGTRVFLSPGDAYVCEVENLGRLESHVVRQ